MHVWSRPTREENLENLLAQLSQVDPLRLIVTRQPGKVFHTVSFYAEDREELPPLQKHFGGSISEVVDLDWLAPMQNHPPIQIRNRFALVEEASPKPTRPEIVIPAGNAFGTGDHPTTATCLRLLCDVAEKYPKGQWSLLDAGSGSGVIAIAAKWLGASEVEAFDFDPNAVRTARENSRLNHQRGIRWRVDDLLKLETPRTFDVVAANIYSELFLASWPRLRQAVGPGGKFILSGILRFQAEDCVAAITASGLTVLRQVHKGKWVTFLAVQGSG